MENLMGVDKKYQFEFNKKWLIPKPVENSEMPEFKEVYQTVFFNEYHPSGHKIFDKMWYKDINILDKNGKIIDLYEVNRVSLPIQEMSIDVILAHLMGNPLYLEDSSYSDSKALPLYKEYWVNKNIETAIYKFTKSVLALGDGAILFYKKNKQLHFKVLSMFTHDKYKMETDKYGDDLRFYHYYDNKCDVYEGDDVTTFDMTKDGNWKIIEKANHGFKGLPIVYYKREVGPFWTPVQNNIENAEKMMSRLSEDNRSKFKSLYHLATEDPNSVDTVKAGTMDMVITNKDGKFNMLQGADLSKQFEFEYNTQMSIIEKTLGIIFPQHKSSGDMPTGTMKMMFYPTERIVMSLIHEFDSYIDSINSLVIQGFALQHPDYTKDIIKGNLRASIRMFTPQDDASKVNSLVNLRREEIISSKTASAESPYTANDEELRLKKEKEENIIFERKKLDLRIM